MDIRTKEGFAWYIKALATIFIVISFLIISEHPVVSAILSFLCLLILTARSGIEINFTNKTFQEYMAFFYFIKMGKPQHFDSIERIIIQKDQPQKFSLTGNSDSQIIYRSFIKFIPEKKVHLISDKRKDVLLNQVTVISRRLNVPIKQ